MSRNPIARKILIVFLFTAGLIAGPAVLYYGVGPQDVNIHYRFPPAIAHAARTVSTTVTLSICGDGIAGGPEFCDDGVNSGFYSITIASRTCATDCLSYGPYCGDSIFQPVRGEACDDGNNAGGDNCTANCSVFTPPPPPAPPPPPPGGGLSGTFFGGGLTAPPATRIVVNGKAYPNADVHILRDGVELGTARAAGNADFTFTSSNVSPGVATLGFWANDAGGVKSLTITVTVQVVSGAATTISGVYLPPSISLDKRQLSRGEPITLSGQTIPSVEVAGLIDGDTRTGSASSSESGLWSIIYDTSPLANQQFHNAKSFFKALIGGQAVESGFSNTATFFIGEGDVGELDLCARADMNTDTRVNLVDFSILLFNFGSSEAISDINADGTVNLADFSILLFCWSG